MKETLNKEPKNPRRYVKAEHHYFATNGWGWKVDVDLSKLIKEFSSQDADYTIWYVPLPKSANYDIRNAEPMVEDAHMVGAFYVDMPPNQF